MRLAAPAATLAVAEGIEDALAFMQASGIPTWAAITASGIRSLIPPPLAAITTIILIEDQDANDVGQRAVADAAGRLAKKGYEIKIARPIIGKDINESLLTLGLTETLFTLEDYERGGAAGDWYSRCLTGHNGQVLSNLANVLLAIREDPAWQSMFTRDALFETVLLAPQAATKSMALIGPEYPRPMIDEDITAVQERLQLAGLLHCNKQTVAQAIELVASANTFHPIKDYLEPLRWDGVERLDFWLTDCLGVERTEYAQAVGRLFLIAMVARIYEPGCQSDYMLILEGPQGRKKSSCCRALAGEWFSDNLPENVSSKDAALHLRGKWLVEVAELHTFNRSETAALKAFITRREDIFRPPYGHKEVYRPRQNLFIGTTNRKVYLQDPTGARRFWPVLTTEIDLELLTSQRDQLFAEALVRYRRGEKWWPDPDFEAEHMAPEQDARFEGDVWEEQISGYLSCSRRTTVLSVAMNALSFAKHDVGTAEQRRIAAILEQLGWWRGKRTHGTRWWLPPDGDDGVPQGAAMPHQA